MKKLRESFGKKRSRASKQFNPTFWENKSVNCNELLDIISILRIFNLGNRCFVFDIEDK